MLMHGQNSCFDAGVGRKDPFHIDHSFQSVYPTGDALVIRIAPGSVKQLPARYGLMHTQRTDFPYCNGFET